MQCVGVIAGSSLFHSQDAASLFDEVKVPTEYGNIILHTRMWTDKLKVVYIQRHCVDEDKKYRQPRKINYRGIAAAIKALKCEIVIGIYSVASMDPDVEVGRLVIPDDYFNPFHILHISDNYDAHVVPELHPALRSKIIDTFEKEKSKFDVHVGGTYVQTSGPRFETKAEVRFFSNFGTLIGMTGANEAEMMNEMKIPFAMLAIVDNMGHGIGEKLTLELFKQLQHKNSMFIESAFLHLLDNLQDFEVDA